MEENEPIVIGAVVGIVILLVVAIITVLSKKNNQKNKKKKHTQHNNAVPKKKVAKTNPTKQQQQETTTTKKEQDGIGSLVATLKDHRQEVTAVDISKDYKYFVSASTDRTIRVWFVDSIIPEAKQVRHIRINTDRSDYATAICFSPTKEHYSIAAAMADSRCIHLYDFSDKKTKEGKYESKLIKQFPAHHVSPIISLSFSRNSNFILSISEETEALLWSPNGTVLAKINTHQFKNHFGAISPDNRFLSIGTFTSDTSIWELLTEKKTNTFSKVQRCMSLIGHKASINSLEFSEDSTKIVTASKDGTWKLWNVAVRYQVSEEPKCLATTIPEEGVPLSLISISPNMKHVAVVSSNRNIYVFTIETNLLLSSFAKAHNDTVTSLKWLGNSARFVTSSLDTTIKVWWIGC